MSLLNKRKKPESKPGDGLLEVDRKVLDAIKSRKEMAIWSRDLKSETSLPDQVINKSLKNLLNASLIREVVHVKQKGRKHYIGADFQPSTEVTGGLWYNDDGELDVAYVDQLKDLCLKIIRRLKVATADGVYDFFKANRLTHTECTSQQIVEILRSMVLDNMIIDVKSTGLGEYHSIPVGQVCYRCSVGDANQGGPKAGALVSIPCGVCPRIRQCTPDGLISPSTCVYFTKWLDF
ncbi:uncharacterized protein LOC143567061 [Bidens hawaiensis]|uniref:uncharacterized protein LOC143567061 n=1 Tax=Bidens hawaiensis TaxID=980011 RepID=UPI00404AC7DE